MIEFLRNWRTERREERHKITFEEGFGWAMTQHFCVKIDTCDIYIMMDGIDSPFDDGAYEALRMIEAGECGVK